MPCESRPVRNRCSSRPQYGSWHLHVCALIVLEPVDGPIDADRIRESFVARLPLVPEFGVPDALDPRRSSAAHLEPMTDFDPHAQVHTVDLPHPADDAELHERFPRIAATRLDRSRPLWDLTIFRGYEGNKAALVFKAPHARRRRHRNGAALLCSTSHQTRSNPAWR